MRNPTILLLCLTLAGIQGAVPSGSASAAVDRPETTPCGVLRLPLIAPMPALKAVVEKFNALVIEDGYAPSGATTTRWRELVDDLQRRDRIPAELRAKALLMLAGSFQGDDSVETALSAAQSAFAFAEASGIRQGSLHAAILTMLATREAEAGHTVQAVKHADDALAETARYDGTSSWVYGNAALIAAAAHHGNGDYVEAERLAAKSEGLAVACLPRGNAIIGGMIQRHAATLDALGRTDDALAEGERALNWDEANLPESDVAVADALEALGLTLRNAGRLPEAEAAMRRALDLNARYRPNEVAYRASTTDKLGRILASQSKYREAEALFLAAEGLYAKSHDLTNPLFGTGELRRAAEMAQEQGRLDDALERQRRALTLLETRVRATHPELARARIEYGTMLMIAGRPKEASSVARPSLEVLRAAFPEDDSKRMSAEIAVSLIEVAAGADPASTYAAVAPIAKRMKATLLQDTSTGYAFGALGPTYAADFAVIARLALSARKDEEGFEAIQLANFSRIAAIRAGIAARAMASDPRIHDLIDRQEAAARDHQRLEHERLGAATRGDSLRAHAIEGDLQRTNDDAARIARDLDKVFPAYRALRRPKLSTIAQVRARLERDDVLFAPVTLPSESLVVSVSRDGLQWTTVHASRARVTALTSKIRDSIDASRLDPKQTFDVSSARSLAEIVLPERLSATLDRHRHFIYFASGQLARVPPALLVTSPLRTHVPPEWLVRSHSISIATTMLPRIGQGRRTHDGFLGVGDPIFPVQPTGKADAAPKSADDFPIDSQASSLSALPFASRELQAMSSLYPLRERRLFTGASATKAALFSTSLDRYAVIAFATHSLLPGAMSGLDQPALVLTPATTDGQADNSLLTAGQIAGLKLDADWVILSACETAGGDGSMEERYDGLAAAFIQAGARALLVSQWPVRDDAAERITVAALSAFRQGVDRASALRRSMLDLMRDNRMPGAQNPAIWAPFVLVDQ